jgi:hypothetical protein
MRTEAVQVWAQAVEVAGSLDIGVAIAAMHSRQFDTVLGRIGVDAKVDVTGLEPFACTSGPTARTRRRM